MIKKIFIAIGYLLVGILLYVLFFFLIAKFPVNNDAVEVQPQDSISVFIQTNGVHTDIVFPIKNSIKDWSGVLDARKTKSRRNDFNFVAIGWGDKGFYLDIQEWKDLDAVTAFRAGFGLSSTLMHVTFQKQMKLGGDCVAIQVSAQEYQQMVTFAEKRFKTDAKDNYILVPNASYGNNDSFYEAKGAYSLFYTCNTWTNNVLKAAHLKAALYTLHAQGIFQHYKNE